MKQKLLNISGIPLERVFQFIGLLCLFLSLLLVVSFADALKEHSNFSLPEYTPIQVDDSEVLEVETNLEQYEIISSRNIFRFVEKVEEVRQPERVAEPLPKLEIRLIGSSVTDGTTPFAIIEDNKSRVQDIFEIDDMVFNQARLVEINPENIKVEHAGRIHTLSLELLSKGVSDASGGVYSRDGESFTIPEQELTDALANLPRLLSEARAVPYFRNGRSIGMRLFAIRRGSLYEKLGLENGDIIKSVNGNDVSDPSQALKLFEDLKNQRSINVVVERMGVDQQLRYSIR